MTLLFIGAITTGVAMLANGNEDSPVLWGIVTFFLGLFGAILFGFLGGLLGAGIGAGIYVGKLLRYG